MVSSEMLSAVFFSLFCIVCCMCVGSISQLEMSRLASRNVLLCSLGMTHSFLVCFLSSMGHRIRCVFYFAYSLVFSCIFRASSIVSSGIFRASYSILYFHIYSVLSALSLPVYSVLSHMYYHV